MVSLIRSILSNHKNSMVVPMTKDTNPTTIGTSVTTLYDQTLTSPKFDIKIPAGVCKSGNDIIFMDQNLAQFGMSTGQTSA